MNIKLFFEISKEFFDLMYFQFMENDDNDEIYHDEEEGWN